MKPKYSLIIRWSEDDNCYIAWVPEFGTGVKTHGDSYQEAARMGAEVIESLLDQQPGEPPLPQPWLFHSSKVDEMVGRSLLPNNLLYESRKTTTPPKDRHAIA